METVKTFEKQLMDCPFCDSKVEIVLRGNNFTNKRSAEIECSYCHVKQIISAKHNTIEWCEEVAIKKWNTRAYKSVDFRPISSNRERVIALCNAAYYHKDLGKGLPYDYGDNSFDKWLETNIGIVPELEGVKQNINGREEINRKQKKIADLKNELIAWLNDECPAVAPPLEPYDNSDLSHNFCELLRIRLDEIIIQKGELLELSDVKPVDLRPIGKEGIIEVLRKYHHNYGDIGCETDFENIADMIIATELSEVNPVQQPYIINKEEFGKFFDFIKVMQKTYDLTEKNLIIEKYLQSWKK